MANPIATLFINLRAGTGTLVQDFDKATKYIKRQGAELEKAGKSITALAAPLAAFGGAAIKAGLEYEKGMKALRISGAVGEDLKKLKADFDAVFAKVPQDAKTTGEAIAELHDRTGALGMPLQNLAVQFLKLSRITETDVNTNIRETTRLFNAWGVSIQDQPATLDMLFRASEETGIQVSALSSAVTENAAALRGMGFDVGQAVTLISGFEKEGVNMSSVLAGMKKGLATLSKEGISDTGTAFQMLIDDIKNAGSAAESNQKAIAVFGAKAGPVLADAIRQGKLELGDLYKTVVNGKDTVLAAAGDTGTLSGSFAVLRNQATLALAPIGVQMVNALKNMMPSLAAVIGQLAIAMKHFSELPQGVQTSALAISGLAIALGPLTYAAGAALKVLVSMKNLVMLFSPLLVPLGAVFASLAAVVGVVGFAFYEAYKKSEDFRRGCVIVAEGVQLLIDKLKNFSPKTFFDNFSNGIMVLRLKLAQALRTEDPAAILAEWQAQAKEATATTAGLGKETEKTGSVIDDLKDGIQKTVGAVKTWVTGGENVRTKLDEIETSGGKATDKVKEFNKALSDIKANDELTRISNAFEDATKTSTLEGVKGVSRAEWEEALSSYENALLDIKKNAYMAEKGYSEEQAQALAEAEVSSDRKSKIRERWEYEKQQAIEAHQAHVQFFQGLMEDAISGTRFSFEDQFKKAVTEIAAEWIALMVEGNSDIIGSLTDAVSNWFGKSGIGSLVGIGAGSGVSGIGPVANGAQYAGMLGLGGLLGGGAATGAAPSVPVIVSAQTVPGGAAAAGGAATGATGMAAIGPLVPAIAAAVAAVLFGSKYYSNIQQIIGGKASNKDVLDTLLMSNTLTAPIGFASSSLEDIFGGGKSQGESWREQFIKDYIKKFGSKELPMGGGKLSDSYNQKQEGTLAGDLSGASGLLGMLISGSGGKESNWVSAMLADAAAKTGDFATAMISLKATFDQWGFSVESADAQLKSMFLQGKISEKQFEQGVQQLNILTQETQASYESLFSVITKNLAEDGDPQVALKAFEMMFKKAFEEGQQTGQDAITVLDNLISNKFGPDAAAVFDTAIREAGVNSFEDLQNLGSNQLIILWHAIETWASDTQGAQDDVKKGWEDNTGAVDDYKKKIEEIPTDVTTTVHVETDDLLTDAQKAALDAAGASGAFDFLHPNGFASGGLVDSPSLFRFNGGRSLGAVAEAGRPEHIMPAVRMSNGDWGVQTTGTSEGDVYLVVNAQGAGPDVEYRIMAALTPLKNEIANYAVRRVKDYYERRV